MSVGEALVEARIRAGLTIEEVSARSLIRESVITAMERDDYEACGGPVYVNGYIRAVAAAIGVDPQPLVTEYARILRAASAPAPEPEQVPEPEPIAGFDLMPEYDPNSAPPIEPELIPGFGPVSGNEPDPGPAQAWETEPEQESPAETTLDDLFGAGAQPEPEPETAEPPSPVEPATLPPPAATPPNGIPLAPADPPSPRPAVAPPAATPPSGMPFAPAATPLASTPLATTPSAGTRPAAARPGNRRPRNPRPSSARPEEPRPERTRERRRLRLALVSTVVLLAVVALATTQLVSHAKHGTAATAATAAKRAASPQPTQAATQPATTQPATTKPSATPAASPPAATTLTMAGAAAFGPAGAADGDNPNIAGRAIDGSASTAWQTNWYATATFGELKSGTGLLVDLGSQVRIDEVTILLGTEAGADLELKTGDSTSSLGTRATSSGAGGQVTLKTSTTARYILLWFTALPPDDSGTYQVSVYNITVKGSRT